MDFFMEMNPPTVTAQEHKVTIRNGRPIFYDPPALKAARSCLITALKPHKPEKPYTEGVRLVTRWYFPRGSHKENEFRITRPDTDNLQKLLKDCMTAVGFWTDDALVCSETCEKLWSKTPGIYICLKGSDSLYKGTIE